MFKKSILAAALLLAGGTAASAAEIGVRHTWGTSTRDINYGVTYSEGKSWTAGTESSSGTVFSIQTDKEKGFTVNASANAWGGSGSETEFGSSTDIDLVTEVELEGGAFSEERLVRRGHPARLVKETETEFGLYGDLDTDGVIVTEGGSYTETWSGAGASGNLDVQGSLTITDTEFTRNGTYGSYSYGNTTEFYTGTNTGGFSEVSTFSR